MNYFPIAIKKLILLFTFGIVLNMMAQNGEDDLYINFAEDISNRGTSAAAFLEIGIGAKAVGLGGAFTAYVNDATALYWNPAGITNLQGLSITFNHANWLANTNLEYFGLVIHAGKSMPFGLVLTALDYVDRQPVRTIHQPEGTGEFYGAYDMLLGVSFGLKLTHRFSFGITTKYIHQKIWHETASGFAVDLGILYRSIWKGLSLGASISNFGTDMQMQGRDLLRPYDDDQQNYSNDKLNTILKTDAFPLPLIFRFGLSYLYQFNENNEFRALVDLIHPSNNVESVNLGMEYIVLKRFALRAGYQSLFDSSSENGLTFGFGLENKFNNRLLVALNYAYSNWGLLGNVQRFSIDMEL